MSNESRSPRNDVAEFFIGLAMLCVGGYLFTQNVTVTSSSMFELILFGRRFEGLVFIPLIASIIFLFYKYNWVSKTCCAVSLLLIIANVITNLHLHWGSLSLFATIVMFVLMFGGLGLVMRTLFANPEGKHGKDYNKINER